MPVTARREVGTRSSPVMHMVFELGAKRWKLGATRGLGRAPRIRGIAARDLGAVERELRRARGRLGVGWTAPGLPETDGPLQTRRSFRGLRSSFPGQRGPSNQPAPRPLPSASGTPPPLQPAGKEPEPPLADAERGLPEAGGARPDRADHHEDQHPDEHRPKQDEPQQDAHHEKLVHRLALPRGGHPGCSPPPAPVPTGQAVRQGTSRNATRRESSFGLSRAGVTPIFATWKYTWKL